MLNFGNKEFRNLQEQVLENAKNIEILKERPALKPVVVDELPETGEEGYIYLVPKENGESPDVYDEYVWLVDEERFEFIGSTAIDLQNLPSPIYVTTENKPEGLSYGLRIRNNGWTSDLQQEGGAKLELTGTAVKTATMEVSDAVSYATTGLDWKIKGDSTYNQISIEYNGQPNLKLAGSEVMPRNAQNLGNQSYRWSGLYLTSAGKVDFGDNATITKDSSNRININNGGDAKLKVGASETICKGSFSPDQDGMYALGKSALRWTTVNAISIANDYSNLTLKGNPGITLQMAAGATITPSNNNSYKIGSESSRFNTVFTTTISDATNYINVADIAKKPNYTTPDVFESGTLDASGQGTIDMTETGTPMDGLYMFTYGNCQCFLSLTSTMIQNAATYPIRCTCPMMFNGSAYPGILKIERAADVLTLTVATAGVGNVQPAGFEWKLIKVL